MRQRVRQVLGVMGGAAVLAAVCPSVSAQCAMCRAAIGNSAEAAAAASSMNLAVLVLLIPPVILFCAFFVIAYRYRNAPAEIGPDGLEEQPIARRAVLKKGKRDVRGGGHRSSRGEHDGPTTIAEAT